MSLMGVPLALRIDLEFRDRLFPLTTDELALLEASLVADGCRDPLIVWDGTLIDGHNRYEICTRLGIAFGIHDKTFANREEAMDWMDANQLGRRNITDAQRHLVLGRRYQRAKKAAHDGGKGVSRISGIHDEHHFDRTVDKLAAEHGTSASTIQRAAEFAAAVDADPELQQAVAQKESLREVKKKIREKAAPVLPAKKPLEERAEEIKKLTAEGHDAAQIASALDLSLNRVRDLARRSNVILIDSFIGKRIRGVDHQKAFDATIVAIEEAAKTFQKFDFQQVSANDVAYGIEAVRKAVRVFNKAVKEMEQAHGQVAAS